MPPLDEPESTLQKNMKIHEASFRKAHKDISGDKEDKSAWDELLNSERGEGDNEGRPEEGANGNSNDS